MKGRNTRVEDLLRSEIARILQREVKDPRVNLATVSHVRVARDLSRATVSVSVLGDESEREATIKTLQRAQGFIRSQLARSVRLRRVPEMVFSLDRGAEHSQKISQILEKIHDDSEST